MLLWWVQQPNDYLYCVIYIDLFHLRPYMPTSLEFVAETLDEMRALIEHTPAPMQR